MEQPTEIKLEESARLHKWREVVLYFTTEDSENAKYLWSYACALRGPDCGCFVEREILKMFFTSVVRGTLSPGFNLNHLAVKVDWDRILDDGRVILLDLQRAINSREGNVHHFLDHIKDAFDILYIYYAQKGENELRNRMGMLHASVGIMLEDFHRDKFVKEESVESYLSTLEETLRVMKLLPKKVKNERG